MDESARRLPASRGDAQRATRCPLFSPSVSDDGTIVALKGIHLHSFRPNGRRIVTRQWALNPSQALSSQPIAIDLSPNGRVVATDNAFYSTYYDPRRSEERPTLAFRYVDFLDFRRNKEIGRTDAYYDYGVPHGSTPNVC